MSDVPAILAILGCILLLLSILGGGLTVKEVSVPVVPARMRAVLLPAGLLFLGLGIWLFLPESTRSLVLRPSSAPAPSVAPPAAGQPEAISTVVPIQPTNASPAEVISTQPPPAAVAEWLYRFEGTANLWSNPDNRGSTMQCVQDNNQAHAGSRSARIDLDLVSGGWGDCWVEDSTVRDWSHGEALSFWVRTDHPRTQLTVWIQVGRVDERTGFEVVFDLPAESLDGWTQVTLPWSRFTRSIYGEQGDLEVFDPSIVVLIGYSVLLPDGQGKVSVWIDDVALLTE